MKGKKKKKTSWRGWQFKRLMRWWWG